jgi:hypothetical protein
MQHWHLKVCLMSDVCQCLKLTHVVTFNRFNFFLKIIISVIGVPSVRVCVNASLRTDIIHKVVTAKQMVREHYWDWVANLHIKFPSGMALFLFFFLSSQEPLVWLLLIQVIVLVRMHSILLLCKCIFQGPLSFCPWSRCAQALVNLYSENTSNCDHVPA